MGTKTFLTLTKTTMLVLFRCPAEQIRVSAWSGGSLPRCWINSWNARRTRTPSRPVQLNKFQTSIIYLSWLCKCVFRKRCWLLHWLSCGNGVSVRFTLVRILTDVRDRFCKYLLFSKINILKQNFDTFVEKHAWSNIRNLLDVDTHNPWWNHSLHHDSNLSFETVTLLLTDHLKFWFMAD